MDFLIDRDDENANKVLEVIKKFMGSSLGFTKEDFTKEVNVIMLGRPPFRIDILTSISGVSFAEVFSGSHIYTDEKLAIRCIYINELIKNKKASGRFKDLADA